MTELDLVATGHIRFMARMLVRLVENEIRILVNQLLHGVLDELVKRVQLLPNKTLLIEEAGYDRPAVFLGDLLVFLLSFALHPVPIVVVGRLRGLKV